MARDLSFKKRQTPELAMGLLLLLTRLLLAATLLIWFMLAALLLLTGLLVGVLVLLARIWGLVAHSGSPLLNTSLNQSGRRQLVSREQRFRLRKMYVAALA